MIVPIWWAEVARAVVVEAWSKSALGVLKTLEAKVVVVLSKVNNYVAP